MMDISVVLNTCNRADALRLGMLALMRQTYKNFELVIADDGSTDHTPEVIREAQSLADFPITHVWQKKEGHGRTRILNKGIVASRREYILFTDCDVLAPADLLAVHMRFFSPRHLLAGNMVRMSKEYAASLEPEDIRTGRFEELLTPEALRRLQRKNRKARIQTFLRMKREPTIYATNFSVSKEALVRVNGFDENFRAWGNADGDLRERLKMIGVRPKPIYDRAVVFHMYHPPDPTASLRLNKAYSRRPDIPARCLNGIVKLQGSGDT